MPLQNQTANLLIVTSETSEAERFINALREGGVPVQGVSTPNAERFDELRRQRGSDMILCCAYDQDVDMDGVLAACRGLDADVPLILISDPERMAGEVVKARRGGARALIPRNDLEQLIWVVAREFSDLLRRRDAAGLTGRLQQCERRGRELIEVTNAAVAFIQEGLHLHANRAYLALFGFASEEDLQAAPFLDLVVPEQQKQIRDVLRNKDLASRSDPFELDLRCQRADETQFDARLLAAPAELDDESCLRLILIHREPGVAQGGLAGQGPGKNQGRASLLAQIEAHIGRDRAVERAFAIFFIKFKESAELMRDLGLNRAFELMDEFERVLRSLLADRGFLARVTDDGFGLIVDDLDESQAKALAGEITAGARLPAQGTAKENAGPHCKIGYYLIVGRASAPEDILDAAYRLCIGHRLVDLDAASGEARSTSLAARVKQELTDGDETIAGKIEYALHAGQLKLVYQPIISLMGDNQENYSVLVRLLDEQENLLEAKDFIGPAIRTGLIEEVDKWTIRTAIQVIGEQRRAAHNLSFFVNLSEDTFRNPSVVLWICDCLREFDVRGNWLTFQFQEELAVGNLSGISKLVETLKKIKCRVALNRFGVTERPELLLQGLSLDFVLLKPSYAQGLADDQGKQKRLVELANLAREFNVKSVVTGVEDARALTVLWTAGVDYVQGNFLQRPSPTLEVQA